nr:uncharacterized protein LOC124807630 [Hydra vulgaris]XP_047125660.1 uncharacterized protein LOC124807630 [Hydra vulgaris]
MEKLHKSSSKPLIKSSDNIMQINQLKTYDTKGNTKKMSVFSESTLFVTSTKKSSFFGSRKNIVASIQEEEEEYEEKELEETKNDNLLQDNSNNVDYIRCIMCCSNKTFMHCTNLNTLKTCYRCRHLKNRNEFSFITERRRSLQELTSIPERLCDNETDACNLEMVVEKEVYRLLQLKNRYGKYESVGRRKSIN